MAAYVLCVCDVRCVEAWAYSYKIRRSTSCLFLAVPLFLRSLNSLTPFFVLEATHSYCFSPCPLQSPRYFRSHPFVTDMHDNMTCVRWIQYQALPFTQQIASSDERKVHCDVWWSRLQFQFLPGFVLSTKSLGDRVLVALRFVSFHMEMKTTAKPTDNTS